MVVYHEVNAEVGRKHLIDRHVPQYYRKNNYIRSSKNTTEFPDEIVQPHHSRIVPGVWRLETGVEVCSPMKIARGLACGDGCGSMQLGRPSMKFARGLASGDGGMILQAEVRKAGGEEHRVYRTQARSSSRSR